MVPQNTGAAMQTQTEIVEFGRSGAGRREWGSGGCAGVADREVGDLSNAWMNVDDVSVITSEEGSLTDANPRWRGGVGAGGGG